MQLPARTTPIPDSSVCVKRNKVLYWLAKSRMTAKHRLSMEVFCPLEFTFQFQPPKSKPVVLSLSRVSQSKVHPKSTKVSGNADQPLSCQANPGFARLRGCTQNHWRWINTLLQWEKVTRKTVCSKAVEGWNILSFDTYILMGKIGDFCHILQENQSAVPTTSHGTKNKFSPKNSCPTSTHLAEKPKTERLVEAIGKPEVGCGSRWIQQWTK